MFKSILRRDAAAAAIEVLLQYLYGSSSRREEPEVCAPLSLYLACGFLGDAAAALYNRRRLFCGRLEDAEDNVVVGRIQVNVIRVVLDGRVFT